METDRLAGRNGEIWRLYCNGHTQEALAERFKLSQVRISQIIKEVRDSIPAETREEIVQRETAFLDNMRVMAMEIADKGPIPAYSNGRPVLDADGNPCNDYSGVLAAYDRAVKVSEHLRRMLGVDAPVKHDISVSDEAERTSVLAAEAAARLNDEDD